MNMLQREKIEFVRNAVHTDYRADFVAATMVEGGVSIDQVRLLRLGLSKSGKNIASIEKNFSRDELIDFIDVHARKRDLYESLPEGLFHQRVSFNNGPQGGSSLMKLMEQTRREAFNARFFFRPFEMAIDRISLLAQLYEVCLEKKEKHDEFVRLLSGYWSVLQSIPTEKALVIVYFIAISHRLVDAKQIAKVISVFLDCQVSVERKYRRLTYKTDGGWSLGKGCLEKATVLGDEVVLSLPVVVVRMENVPFYRKELFGTENKEFKKLEAILNMFIPADAELEIQMEVERNDRLFQLTDNGGYSVLGCTTILN